MSENGLSFVSGHAYNVGDELTLAFRFQPSEPGFHIRCIVRYLFKTDDDERTTQIGTEFLDLLLADRLLIIQFIARRAADASTTS